jgi:hypothetical protein
MADAFKTRAQLIERALKSIGALEPGEAPSNEDYATVDGLIDPLIAQLATDQIAYISDAEAIELELFMPLARLLANAAGPDFGSPVNMEAKADDEKILRRLTAAKPTYERLKVDYF